MSYSFKYFFLLSIFILSKSEIEYGPCIDNKRTIKFEDGSSKLFDCIECPSNKYTKYENNALKCVDCPQHSYNYGHDVIIDSFYPIIMERYSPIFETECSNNKNLCPKWENYVFSLKVENINENIDSKSILKWNVYYVNDGKFKIKYMNYNGDINKYLLIYINKVLLYKDDTKNSKIKEREFDINKGKNELEIQYIIDKNLSPKETNDTESFLEIYELQMINAETSSLECQKYDNLDILKQSMLNNCDYYINKCNESDYCTFRFFREHIGESSIKDGSRIVSYNKAEEAVCDELITPPIIEIEAEQCSYGQFRNYTNENENLYTCEHCTGDLYNNKLINYEFSCNEKCDTTKKELKKIQYINNFADKTQYGLEINIVDLIGYVEIIYEKYNIKEDAIIFVETSNITNNQKKTYKVINPNTKNYRNDKNFLFRIPLLKGEYNFEIKGKNLKLMEIKIINGEKGGNYKCTNKLYPNEEIICDKKYYSPNEQRCEECHYGSFITDNSNCIFTEKIISNKFILESSLLIKDQLISSSKIIQGKDNTQFILFLNPTYPLIYKKNNTDGTIQIIGNEFNKVKLIRGINDRGIIMSYFHIDIDNELNYTSYVYIKCNHDEKQEKLELIKEEDKENNKYFYFKIVSPIGCPYCLERETEEIKIGECTKDNIQLYNKIPKNNLTCTVRLYDNSISSNITIDLNDEMLLFYNSSNYEDQNLTEIYNITEEIPIYNEKEEDKIVTEIERNGTCEYEKKEDDSLKAGYIALIIVGGVIVILLIVLLIWKLCKRQDNFDENCPEDVKELLESR